MLKDLTIRGFILADALHAFGQWPPLFGRWLAEGTFVYPHTVVLGGIEAAPRALVDLVAGRLRGNVVVDLAD